MWSLAVAALVCVCFAACLPEFEPDLGDGVIGGVRAPRCGVQGEPCCAAPAEPCEPALSCDAETQSCLRRPVLLCNTDAECQQEQVCCMAGLVGTCEAVARDDCPALDLMTTAPQLDVDPVEWRTFDPSSAIDQCLIDRGCVGGPGLRRLLGVSTIVNNVGDADLLLGSPQDMSVPTITSCDGELRFASFLRLELLDASGPQLQQDIAASCSAASSGPFIAPFDCDFQGLWSGFAQPYESGATGAQPREDCRWLDITDVVPGDYTLRVTVNPDASLLEQNLENNTPAELPISIPAFGDPTARCPDPPNPLLGYYDARECGWVRAPFQADGQATECIPGDYVPLTCTSDDSSSICGAYRTCDGPDVCSHGEAIPPPFIGCADFTEPNIFLTCPETGRYSLWLAGDAASGFTCEPYFDDIDAVLAARANVGDAGPPP